MKKNVELRIDFEHTQIIMSSAFAKKCQNTANIEYKRLQEVRRDYPDFTVVRKQIAKPKVAKESYRGLTYEYMENYIEKHDKTGKIMNEFLGMIELSKCHSIRYSRIKNWFLEKFPEIVEYGMPKAEENEEQRENTGAKNVFEANANNTEIAA